MKTLADLDVRAKRVFVRCDFNVPVDEAGRITSDSRISRTLPTIREILARGGSCILASHFGRPKKGADPKYSLGAVAKRLSELLKKNVPLLAGCVGSQVEAACRAIKPGEVVLLENLRFHLEEEANDPAFAKSLAGLADLYVNDAFGASHRAHASIAGVPRHLPSAAGLLVQAEIQHLGELVKNPARPFVAILGGAKISDKIAILESLIERVDVILIGGAMAYTFLAARKIPIGTSRFEREMLETASKILVRAEARGAKALLPVDHLTVTEFKPTAAVATEGPGISAGRMGVDVGPKTVRLFAQEIARARSVLWNGPVGVFEVSAFAQGTKRLAEILAGAKAHVVIGGGDSAAAVEEMGLADKMAHVSTGGGASLEYLAQGTLPGIEALEGKDAAHASHET